MNPENSSDYVVGKINHISDEKQKIDLSNAKTSDNTLAYISHLQCEIQSLQSKNEKLEAELKTCRELSDLRLDGESRYRKENYKLIELVRELEKSLKDLIQAIRDNGYFNEWEPDFSMHVVVDGEIDKDIWARAKETLSLIEKSGVLK